MPLPLHFRWSFIFSTYGLYFLPGSNIAPFQDVKVQVSNSAAFSPWRIWGGWDEWLFNLLFAFVYFSAIPERIKISFFKFFRSLPIIKPMVCSSQTCHIYIYVLCQGMEKMWNKYWKFGKTSWYWMDFLKKYTQTQKKLTTCLKCNKIVTVQNKTNQQLLIETFAFYWWHVKFLTTINHLIST